MIIVYITDNSNKIVMKPGPASQSVYKQDLGGPWKKLRRAGKKAVVPVKGALSEEEEDVDVPAAAAVGVDASKSPSPLPPVLADMQSNSEGEDRHPLGAVY